MLNPNHKVSCSIKQHRLRQGWSQEDLARRVGLRRQAVYDMESGRYLPNTVVALRLAEIFDCRVEDLFSLADTSGKLPVRLAHGEAGAEPGAVADGARLALGMVRGELVGVPLDPATGLSMGLQPADAILEDGGKSARLLVSPKELGSSLLLMGCDPALDLLGAHVLRLLPSARVHSLFASSRKALSALARGEAHAAGTHFHGGAGSGKDANVAAARQAMSGVPCRVMGFSFMEEGLITARGNPLGIREAADLAGGARFVNRGGGAALRKLLDDKLGAAGVPSGAVSGYDHTVRTHHEGAIRVACGLADAALGVRSVAEAFGLHFVPLAVTRFDLVLPLEAEENPAVVALLEALQTSRLRRDLSGVPGCDGQFAGNEIALLS